MWKQKLQKIYVPEKVLKHVKKIINLTSSNLAIYTAEKPPQINLKHNYQVRMSLTYVRS